MVIKRNHQDMEMFRAQARGKAARHNKRAAFLAAYATRRTATSPQLQLAVMLMAEYGLMAACRYLRTVTK